MHHRNVNTPQYSPPARPQALLDGHYSPQRVAMHFLGTSSFHDIILGVELHISSVTLIEKKHIFHLCSTFSMGRPWAVFTLL